MLPVGRESVGRDRVRRQVILHVGRERERRQVMLRMLQVHAEASAQQPPASLLQRPPGGRDGDHGAADTRGAACAKEDAETERGERHGRVSPSETDAQETLNGAGGQRVRKRARQDSCDPQPCPSSGRPPPPHPSAPKSGSTASTIGVCAASSVPNYCCPHIVPSPASTPADPLPSRPSDRRLARSGGLPIPGPPRAHGVAATLLGHSKVRKALLTFYLCVMLHVLVWFAWCVVCVDEQGGTAGCEKHVSPAPSKASKAPVPSVHQQRAGGWRLCSRP